MSTYAENAEKTDKREKTGKARLRIRPATISDAARLLEIYAPYVTDTAITFEYEIPSLEEFRQRIAGTLEKYPYLVAVEVPAAGSKEPEAGNKEPEAGKSEAPGAERILGYAYLSAFHPRAAYQWCAETSIYVDKECKNMGIGGALYRALETEAGKMHLLNLNACIALPEVPDRYLDNNSVDFHTHMGYQMVGKFHNCGYKFNRWYHMIWMEKMIGEHPENPQPICSQSAAGMQDSRV